MGNLYLNRLWYLCTNSRMIQPLAGVFGATLTGLFGFSVKRSLGIVALTNSRGTRSFMVTRPGLFLATPFSFSNQPGIYSFECARSLLLSAVLVTAVKATSNQSDY